MRDEEREKTKWSSERQWLAEAGNEKEERDTNVGMRGTRAMAQEVSIAG